MDDNYNETDKDFLEQRRKIYQKRLALENMETLDTVRQEVFKNYTNLVGNDILSVFIKKTGVDGPVDPLVPKKYKGMTKQEKIEKFAAQILINEESD